MADWWANDAVAGGTATAGNWWEQDKSASAEFEAMYQDIGARVDPADYGPMKDVLDQDEFGNLQANTEAYAALDQPQREQVNQAIVGGNAEIDQDQASYDLAFGDANTYERFATQTVASLGSSLKNLWDRVTGDEEGVQENVRDMGRLRQAFDGQSGNTERMLRGVTESLGGAAYMAPTGVTGIIGKAIFDSYNDNKTAAIDSGMPEADAVKYARGTAAIEGTVSALFQRLGMGGTENLLGRVPAWKGFREFAKQAFGELSEEEIIGHSQSTLAKLADIDPNDWSTGEAVERTSEIALQSLLSVGLARGMASVANFVNKPRPSRKDAEAIGILPAVPTQRARTDLARRVKEEAKTIISTMSVTTNGEDESAPMRTDAHTTLAPEADNTDDFSDDPMRTMRTNSAPANKESEATEPPPGPTLPPDPVQMAAGIPLTKATATWFKRNFLSGGLQTEDVRKLVYRRDSIVRGHTAELAQNNRDLMREAKKAYGKLDDTVAQQLDAALKDPALAAQLPTDVAVVVQKMRDHIDGLSDQIQALGDTGADLFLSIEKNKGVYVTRSYRKFKDPEGWRGKALRDPQIMGDFAAEVRQSSPNATDEDILQLADILLRRKTMQNADLKATGSRTNGYVNVLKRRKDLSQAVRKLYGEQTDAFQNYAETIGQMSSLVANKAFVENLKADGLAKGYFSDVNAPNPGHVQEVAFGQHRQLEGLQDVLMDPDLASAINDLYAMPPMNGAAQFFAALSTTSKAMKTVFSPKSWARNFLGNPAIAIANGHWSLKDFGRSANATWLKDIFNQSDPTSKAEVRRLKELGIIEGVHMEALKDSVAQVTAATRWFAGLDPEETVKRVTSGAAKGYQAMDTIWKLHNYYGELDVLSRAFPNTSKIELEEMAARRVREITPTYSEASKAARYWSRYVPVGPFAMFPAEIIRTTGNRLRLIAEDAKSGNPILQKQAVKRGVGQLAALGFTIGVSEFSKWLLGIGDDQDDAVRERLADWQKNSAIAYWSTDADGMPKDYFDLGFTDPFGVLTKPGMALLRGKTDEALGELTQPFTSDDIFWGTVLALRYNRDENNQPIWSEGLAPAEQNKQLMDWTFKRLEPGAVTSVKRISSAAKGETTASGQELSLSGEIVSNFTGTKLQVFDRQTSDYYKNREFDRLVNASSTAIRKAFLRKGSIALSELEQTYRSADATRRKTMTDWRKYVDGSILLGETNPYAKVVRDVGSESAIVKAMYSKRYAPYTFRPVDLRAMSKLPDGPARIELWKRLHAEASATPRPEDPTP